jgi:phosphomannomutase
MDVDRIAMLSSTVSSHLLAQIARLEGFKFKETLTGFKNIGNEALDLEKKGYKVLFAYEEALGYMFDTGIFDKDGIASIVVWAELATELSQRGTSMANFLETIYKTSLSLVGLILNCCEQLMSIFFSFLLGPSVMATLLPITAISSAKILLQSELNSEDCALANRP